MRHTLYFWISWKQLYWVTYIYTMTCGSWPYLYHTSWRWIITQVEEPEFWTESGRHLRLRYVHPLTQLLSLVFDLFALQWKGKWRGFSPLKDLTVFSRVSSVFWNSLGSGNAKPRRDEICTHLATIFAMVSWSYTRYIRWDKPSKWSLLPLPSLNFSNRLGMLGEFKISS